MTNLDQINELWKSMLEILDADDSFTWDQSHLLAVSKGIPLYIWIGEYQATVETHDDSDQLLLDILDRNRGENFDYETWNRTWRHRNAICKLLPKPRKQTTYLTFFDIDFDGADAVDALPLIAEAFSHRLEFIGIVDLSGYAQFSASMTLDDAVFAMECLKQHADDGIKVFGNQEGIEL